MRRSLRPLVYSLLLSVPIGCNATSGSKPTPQATTSVEPSPKDTDTDEDGISDEDEGRADAVDTDGDGKLDFEDTDSDCVRDTGEEWVTGITVTSDVNAVANTECLSFATTGFKRVIAGQPSTSRMLYCDSRGNTLRYPGGNESAARGVEIPPTGRGVVVKRVDEITTWNSGDDAVACP